MWFLSLFICIFTTSILEMRWSRVTIHEWWRNQQFWVMGGISAHLFALFIGLFKVLVGVNTNMILTKTTVTRDNDHDHSVCNKVDNISNCSNNIDDVEHNCHCGWSLTCNKQWL
ncbi:hypothetical protein S83_033676 [Arachis hypogaea]